MDDERAVQQVLARYVRAADHRDEPAMANLFADDGVVEIFYSNGGTPEKIAQLDGDRASIDAQFVVSNTVGDPRPEAGWPDGATGAQGTITHHPLGRWTPPLSDPPGSLVPWIWNTTSR